MMKMARPFAVLATALLAAAAPAAPAFAQPGVVDPAVAEDPPPVNAGTVVIVTPQAPVVAQPAGPPPMASATSPAPQTDDWNNVSHINGQLVKVGEHGDYLYNNGKTTNISTNPIGWMFGFYGVSISHAVHQNVALRGDVNIFSFSSSGGYEVGVSAPIYFRRVFQGPFLEPGLMVRNTTCNGCNAGDPSVGPEVMFGWHWTFDSGLNVAMAFGAMRNMNGRSMSSSDPEPAGYFRIGYAF